MRHGWACLLRLDVYKTESTAFKQFCVFIVITALISTNVASFISLHIITIRRRIKKAKINTESNKN